MGCWTRATFGRLSAALVAVACGGAEAGSLGHTDEPDGGPAPPLRVDADGTTPRTCESSDECTEFGELCANHAKTCNDPPERYCAYDAMSELPLLACSCSGEVTYDGAGTHAYSVGNAQNVGYGLLGIACNIDGAPVYLAGSSLDAFEGARVHAKADGGPMVASEPIAGGEFALALGVHMLPSESIWIDYFIDVGDDGSCDATDDPGGKHSYWPLNDVGSWTIQNGELASTLAIAMGGHQAEPGTIDCTAFR